MEARARVHEESLFDSKDDVPLASVVKKVASIQKKYHFKKTYFGGVPEFQWSLEEYEKNHPKYPHLTDNYTKLGVDEKIKLFADFDMGFETQAELPNIDEECDIREAIIDVFKSLFLNKNIIVNCAYRPMGYMPKMEKGKDEKYHDVGGKWKVSFRLWASGLYTTRGDMLKKLKGFMPDLSKFPEVVQTHKEFGKGKSFFDTSVYHNGRSMCIVGKTKTRDDKQTLLQCDSSQPIEQFIIQHVEDDWEPIEWGVVGRISSKREADDDFVHVDAEDGDPVNKRKAKKLKLGDEENEMITCVRRTISKCYPDSYLPRDFGNAKESQNGLTVFLKTKYCLLSEADHEVSVPKMYFNITKKHLKFTCTHCDASDEMEHDDPQLSKFFAQTDIGIDDRLDLKVAKELLDSSGEAAVIAYLNNFWAKITEESSVSIASRTSVSTTWLLRKPSEFKKAFEHLHFFYETSHVDDNGKPKNVKACYHLVQKWQSHNDMRLFRNVKFRPSHLGDADGEYLNLFRGFKAKQLPTYDMSKFQPLLDHAKHILCNNDGVFFEYLINWQAHIVQRPHIKTQTAPVFFGAQETTEKREMAGYSRAPLDLFVDDLLEGNVVYKDVPGHRADGEWVQSEKEYFEAGNTYQTSMDRMFTCFVSFCNTDQAGRVDSKLNKQVFGKLLR
ncbi:hypothetical protein HDU89_000960, partial [Geranomyces variabilis]